METLTLVSVLKGATDLVGAALAIRDWFISSYNDSNVSPSIMAALGKLPEGSSAQDITTVLKPYYESKGGSVTVNAGNNGGGDIEIDDTGIKGGSAHGGGGDVTVSGGDGGPHGKGGDVKITSGIIKGGDAI